jgi:hypothetical protein
MTQFVGSPWARDDDVTLPSLFRALAYASIVETRRDKDD